MTDQTLIVTATTAVPLTNKQQQTLTTAVEKKNAGATVKLVEVVDPGVIGGIRLTVGSLDFDATVKNKLASIKYQLKEKVLAE